MNAPFREGSNRWGFDSTNLQVMRREGVILYEVAEAEEICHLFQALTEPKKAEKSSSLSTLSH